MPVEVREHHRTLYYVENFFTKKSLSDRLEKAPFRVDEYQFTFNSPLAHRLFVWGEMRGFTGLPFLPMFPFAYPAVKLSDGLFGKREEGYDLYVRATRLER